MTYIKDEEFIRGNCPMTKEEVRILSTAKLSLMENFKVIDVGAGTGSVSIQACKIAGSGEVIAVERDLEAVKVIYENKQKFKTDNLTIIHEDALKAAVDIEGEFDAIFVGGSGGDIEDIIRVYGDKLKPSRNMVLNFITLENVYRAVKALEALNYRVECLQVSVSKSVGKSLMLMANNPIFIVTGVKPEMKKIHTQEEENHG